LLGAEEWVFVDEACCTYHDVHGERRPVLEYDLVVFQTFDVVVMNMDVFRDSVPKIWSLDHAKGPGTPEEAAMA